MPPKRELTAEEREHNKRKYAREKVSTADMILPAGYLPIEKGTRNSRKGKWQCPFRGCSKGPQAPVAGKQNLWRHMVHVHRTETEGGTYRDNGDGTFSSAVVFVPASAPPRISTRQEDLAEEEIAHTIKHDDGTRVFGILDLATNEYIETSLLAHLWELENSIAEADNIYIDPAIAISDTETNGGKHTSRGPAYGQFRVNDNYFNGRFDLRWDNVMYMPEMVQHWRIYGLWDDEVDSGPA